MKTVLSTAAALLFSLGVVQAQQSQSTPETTPQSQGTGNLAGERPIGTGEPYTNKNSSDTGSAGAANTNPPKGEQPVGTDERFTQKNDDGEKPGTAANTNPPKGERPVGTGQPYSNKNPG